MRSLRRIRIIIALAGLLAGTLAISRLSEVPGFSQTTAPSATSALRVGAGSQQVPAGTLLTIAFQTAMDSRVTNAGDPFVAFLAKDFTTAPTGPDHVRRVILPAGTVIRGRVSEVKRPFLFSHGGAISLAFDHAMLPSGDLMPLTLNLAAENAMVNKQGALYSDPGIGRKVEKGLEEGKKVFSSISERGIQAGKQIAGGLGSLVTVPATVVGGAVAGTAVTGGKAVVAVIGKGESVVIQPGDTMTIDFGGSFNLPAE